MKRKYYWKVIRWDNDRRACKSAFKPPLGIGKYTYAIGKWTVLKKTRQLNERYGLCVFETEKHAKAFRLAPGPASRGAVFRCRVGRIWSRGNLPLPLCEDGRPRSFGWPPGTVMTDRVMLIERAEP